MLTLMNKAANAREVERIERNFEVKLRDKLSSLQKTPLAKGPSAMDYWLDGCIAFVAVPSFTFALIMYRRTILQERAKTSTRLRRSRQVPINSGLVVFTKACLTNILSCLIRSVS